MGDKLNKILNERIKSFTVDYKIIDDNKYLNPTDEA